MKVPAWDIWSSDTSWGMRELDTRKLREGASIEEAYSGTVHHVDMGCIPELSHTNDALIMGQFLKDWAWRVAVPQLLDEHRRVLAAYNELAIEMSDINNVADRLVVTRLEPGKS